MDAMRTRYIDSEYIPALTELTVCLWLKLYPWEMQVNIII